MAVKVKRKNPTVMAHIKTYAPFIAVLGVIIAAATFWLNLQNNRAEFTVESISFDPFPLRAGRARIAVWLKNSSQNAGKIDKMAINRMTEITSTPIYDENNFVPQTVGGESKLRIISDLGATPLTLTQSEINSLKNGYPELKIVGFAKYFHKYWFLGGGVIGFCYVWDPIDTSVGNFSACPEKQYTYAYNFWFIDGIQFRKIPTIRIDRPTISPTTAPILIPDPRFHIPELEIQTR